MWVKAVLLHTDAEYLRKHWTGVKASAPTLEKRHRKYFLRFTYEEKREFDDKPVKEQRICAVDSTRTRYAVSWRRTELSPRGSSLTLRMKKTVCGRH